MTPTTAIVQFDGSDLTCVVDDDGVIHVVVARVCEALGLDTESQRKRLQSQAWGMKKTSLRPVTDKIGRAQATLCVELDALPMWLAGVEVSKTALPATQARLVRFQLEARDILAAHFGMGGRVNLPSPRASGGAVGSGGAIARPVPSAPAGFDDLAVIEHLVAAVRADRLALVAVNARIDEAGAAVAAANARAVAAEEKTADVALLVDSMAKKGVHFRESARAIKNAVAHISRRVRAEAPYTNYDWRTIYGAARNELGLARSPASRTSSPSGAAPKKPKPIGESIKRADQALTYARVATKHGITGCDVATINRILNADDDANTVDAETQAIQ